MNAPTMYSDAPSASRTEEQEQQEVDDFEDMMTTATTTTTTHSPQKANPYPRRPFSMDDTREYDGDEDKEPLILTLRHTHNPQPSVGKIAFGTIVLIVMIYVVLKLVHSSSLSDDVSQVLHE